MMMVVVVVVGAVVVMAKKLLQITCKPQRNPAVLYINRVARPAPWTGRFFSINSTYILISYTFSHILHWELVMQTTVPHEGDKYFTIST
jgi:hypothetical protein